MKRVSYRFCTGRTKSITRSFFTYVLGVFPQTFLNSADLIHQNDFFRTINVQYTNDSSFFHNRYNDFRIRSTIASDVTWELVNVRYKSRCFRFSRNAANASSKWNAHASRHSLERSKNKLSSFCYVKANPINAI